jgi:hypothetical protein
MEANRLPEVALNVDGWATVLKRFLARTCALLIVVQTVILGWMSRTQTFEPPPNIPGGLGSPILGIELAKTAEEVRGLFRDPFGCHNRAVFRDQIHEDWVFIPVYTSFFIATGLLLAFRPSLGWRAVAVLIAGLATTGAHFDYREDDGILRLISEPSSSLTDAMAIATRSASLIKWSLLFLATGLLALVFFGPKPGSRLPRFLANAAGALLVLSAVAGLVGIAFNPAIAWGSFALPFGLVPALLVLSFTPERLPNSLRVARPAALPASSPTPVPGAA